jgi:DNA-binding IclR family transcriptional regulator
MIEVCDRDEYIRAMANDDTAASSKQQPLLVLGKITEILDAFSLSHPDMTLGEIQQATGLPTSTVQRLVSNMVAQGLLDRTGDRVRIGVRMSYWAATALKDLDVLAVVNPVLKEIRDKTG